MRIRLIIAVVLISIGAIIHTVGGELLNINSLMNTDIPENSKLEIRAGWYFVAIDFFMSAFYITFLILKEKIQEQKMLVNFIGIRMILYGLLFLLLIFIVNKSMLFLSPQWMLLLGVGILICWDLFKTILISKEN